MQYSKKGLINDTLHVLAYMERTWQNILFFPDPPGIIHPSPLLYMQKLIESFTN